MGYNTIFKGSFEITPELDDETFRLLRGINQTRRMKRMLPAEYGEEGEFYIDGKGLGGCYEDETVMDPNKPPGTQPGLWCGWVPTDRNHIEWDQSEKFENYIEWITYLIKKILKPRGYVLNGQVVWDGEMEYDRGVISIENNDVSTGKLEFIYQWAEDLRHK